MKENLKKITRKSAWVIGWDGTDEKYTNHKHIIAVLDSRIFEEKIKDFVENYYISATASNYEKVYYPKNKRNNPYPAEYGKSRSSIICGHNPFIYAEIVKNISIIVNNDDSEEITWDQL